MFSKCWLRYYRYELAFFCFFFLWLALDLWTKYLVYTSMHLGQTIELPVSWIQLTYVRNTGGAFGIMRDSALFFTIAAVSILACVYWFFPYACRVGGMWGSILLAGLASGGVGNLYDRLRFGYVVDFLDLKWWPVFNVADIGITVAMTVVILWAMFGKRLEFDDVVAGSDTREE